MNDCNLLDENDTQPIHLCSVCLKKLPHAISFDCIGRYRKLGKFYEQVGYIDEAKWIYHRLEHLERIKRKQEGNNALLQRK